MISYFIIVIPLENCLIVNMDIGRRKNETIVCMINKESSEALFWIVVLASLILIVSGYFFPVILIGSRIRETNMVNVTMNSKCL